MIHFSDCAIAEIQRLKIQQSRFEPAPSYLRLAVIQDGCAGLAYDLRFDRQQQLGDHQFTIDHLQVLVDPVSAEQVQGLAIDYTEDLMGGGFQFSNPQAKRTCSCGISFTLSPDNTDEWTVDCGL
ncbi:MAG: iron-sulfur cluster insertion protein ErpA [Cyanobacteriota bacterium]|jgi:iron-sulfur cluster assembly protein